MNNLHILSNDIQETTEINNRRVWRPSVPLPLFVGFGLKRAQCVCGQKFKTQQAYKEHYIYHAVWQDESGYIPALLAKQRVKKS